MPDQPPNADPAGSEPTLSELARALLGGADSAPAHPTDPAWQPPAPQVLQALLPQYEILDMIGRGGMGAVYLATQSALDRCVAIKILSTELDARDPGFSERFKNEARAMAKLSHPGIVAIHEFGETDTGLHYIVMEFVEGTNVQQMINASRRLHTEHALAITARVCDALHYAHQRGIIHRDIKPANIIVGYDGSVKVADFGLAKVSAADSGTRHLLTRSGTTLGTPHYIAPEALIPGTVMDARADIYALGVMLYHMLTGKLPQGLFELPSIQVPGLDPRLDAIIARAMREDRELRYPTAADMRAGIDSLLTQPIPQTGPEAHLPTEARPQRPGVKVSSELHSRSSTKAPFPFWTWAAALVCLAAAIWLYLGSGQPRASMQETTAPVSDPATPASPSTAQTDWLAGRWHQTFGDSTRPIYLVELNADHTARFAGGSLRTTGRWKLENEALEISWSNGARYHLEVPGNRPSTDLRGMIFNLDNTSGKNVPVHLQKAGEETSKPVSGPSESHVQPPSSPTPLVAGDPAAATKENPFTNSLGMKFVPVPGTSVLFCIHETRRRDYEAYATENPGIDTNWKSRTQYRYVIPEPVDGHPVAVIYWHDAKAFCEWLSKKEGKTYRLPTDREWSIAAGIGDKEKWKPGVTPQTLDQALLKIYPWGEGFPPPAGAGNYGDESRRAKVPGQGDLYIKGYDDGFPTTAPVMSFAPNAFGLFDMSGNVWEWVEDWYSEEMDRRVLRGSSWQGYTEDHLLLSKRSAVKPDARNSFQGFRVVLEFPNLSTPANNSSLSTSPPSKKTYPPSSPAPLGARDPADATKDRPFINTLGMQFVPVPGTRVLFCIHETRRSDYAAYAAERPLIDKTWERPVSAYNGMALPVEDDTHPVSSITHPEARAFCDWLSSKENRRYRLPTDREWSLAAGIGAQEDPSAPPQALSGRLPAHFPWGGSWPPAEGDGNYADQTWLVQFPQAKGCIETLNDGHMTTAPVMTFRPNEFGIYDLGGNVQEHTRDLLENGLGVLRGGSWFEGQPAQLLSSAREFTRDVTTTSNRPAKWGFRIVLEAGEPD